MKLAGAARDIATFLDDLPDDRRATIERLAALVREHLPHGYEEAFHTGMIVWQVPLAVYPDTYNKKPLMYAALGNQKNHVGLYLCGVYGDGAQRKAFETR